MAGAAMSTSPSASATSKPQAHARTDVADLWQRLLYRWFVEYNPLYLLSAALVLAGCFLLSRGLARDEGIAATFGITLISEVYAFALLGGAALLVRIGQRRPAVMLAFLSLLYQWDLTLHTETCAYLGNAGLVAAFAWLVVFAAKLSGLAWALRIRLATRVVAAAAVGAIGLAFGPRLIPALDGRGAGALVAVWCFVLGALYRSGGGIESNVEVVGWGETVLRRATRAAWLLSGALLSIHLLFLASDHAISLSFALPVAPLLFARRVEREGRMWALVLATLGLVAAFSPAAFSLTALLAAAALVLRALSPAFEVAPSPVPPAEVRPAEPYRSNDAGVVPPPVASPGDTLPTVGDSERARSYVGAFFALYLSAWTTRWSGGPWPAHLVWLDAALTIALLIAAWKLHSRAVLAPLAPVYAHLVVAAQIISAPRSPVEWGATFVGMGFALLVGSIATSYRLRLYPLGPTRPSAGVDPERAGRPGP